MGEVWQSLVWAFGAAVVIVAHFVLAALLIVLVWGSEQLLGLLWGEADPLLFDSVPLKYLFHAIEAAIIVLFGIYGIIEAIKTFRRR
jgi:hypothetical protein